jgi:uncharacterized protein YbcI
MSAERRLPPQDASRLIRAGEGEADVAAAPGSLRAALANAMVGIKAKYYGKGPVKAKAYLVDRHVFVVMEGGLTASEEVLLAAGKADAVRSFRLTFEEAISEAAIQAVEEIVGREVLGYHSQIVFDPTFALEWFVLSEAPDEEHEAEA